MALPTKGTRSIHVDGGDYRWVVSPDSGYMVVVIEGANASRRRLFVYTDYRDLLTPSAAGAGFDVTQQRRITPGYVRRSILAGRAAGWDPLEPGSDVRLACRVRFSGPVILSSGSKERAADERG